jgi:hypothetical protein
MAAIAVSFQGSVVHKMLKRTANLPVARHLVVLHLQSKPRTRKAGLHAAHGSPP